MNDPDFLIAWRAAAAASAAHDVEGFQRNVAACLTAAHLALDDLPCLEAHWRDLVSMQFDLAQFTPGLSLIHKMSGMSRVERMHMPQIMAVEALLKDYAEVLADSTAFAERLMAEPGLDSGADIEIVGPMALLNPAAVGDREAQRVWRRVLTQALAIAKSKEQRAVVIPDMMAPFCAAPPADRLVLSFGTRSDRPGTLNVSAVAGAETAGFLWYGNGAWHDDSISTQNPGSLRRKLESLLYP